MTRSDTLGRFFKILIGIVVGSLLIFVIFTWLALEAGGVAILETQTADGSMRSTHVWFAMPDDENGGDDLELWVEAGTPENGWYADIQERARLTLTTNSEMEVSGRYLAEPVPGEASHQKIRTLLRQKYGIRDWWIATIFDTSHSIAVRLIPISPAAAAIPIPTPGEGSN